MGIPKDYHRLHLEGTMEGWFQDSTLGSSAKGAHWVTFFVLAACTLFLCRDSWKARGPSGRERFYAGYHEEYNISLFVNLFATIAYFGKIVADSLGHNYVNVGPLVIGLGNYRYADYMLTCPLLAYDLLSQVRGPYKVLGAVLIFSVLLTGAATNFYPGSEMRAGALAWFCFGCSLYTGAYWLFVTVVRVQYERLQTLAQGTDAKKSLVPLRLAIYTFFTIWIVFPVVWLLGDQGFSIVSADAQEVLHCVCDIVAKSFYGFALARYRSYFDKKLFAALEELGLDGEEELENLQKDLKDVAGISSTIGFIRSREGSLVEGKSAAFPLRRTSGHFVPISPRKTPLQQELAIMSPQKIKVSKVRGHPKLLPIPPISRSSPLLDLDRIRALAHHVGEQLRNIEMEELLSVAPKVAGSSARDRRRAATEKLQSKVKMESDSSDSGSVSNGSALDFKLHSSASADRARQRAGSPTWSTPPRSEETPGYTEVEGALGLC